MKLLIDSVIALCVLSGSGCVTKPDSLVINGLSKHVNAKTEKDETNAGLGVRFDNYEIGFYDNSRVRDSVSIYALNRLFEIKDWSLDVGGVYYSKGDGYNDYLTPVLKINYDFKGFEIGFSPNDLITL